MKHILFINGSASKNSSNERLIAYLISQLSSHFTCSLIDHLQQFPHFEPSTLPENKPASIHYLEDQIRQADCLFFCTPEYIFSIPSALKNLFEWLVSSDVFMQKKAALITASAQGEKAHAEMQLILKTVMMDLPDQRSMLIQGIKGKINEQGEITCEQTKNHVDQLITHLLSLKNASPDRI